MSVCKGFNDLIQLYFQKQRDEKLALKRHYEHLSKESYVQMQLRRFESALPPQPHVALNHFHRDHFHSTQERGTRTCAWNAMMNVIADEGDPALKQSAFTNHEQVHVANMCWGAILSDGHVANPDSVSLSNGPYSSGTITECVNNSYTYVAYSRPPRFRIDFQKLLQGENYGDEFLGMAYRIPGDDSYTIHFKAWRRQSNGEYMHIDSMAAQLPAPVNRDSATLAMQSVDDKEYEIVFIHKLREDEKEMSPALRKRQYKEQKGFIPRSHG